MFPVYASVFEYRQMISVEVLARTPHFGVLEAQKFFTTHRMARLHTRRLSAAIAYQHSN